MKKLFTVLLVAILAFGLFVSCEDKKEPKVYTIHFNLGGHGEDVDLTVTNGKLSGSVPSPEPDGDQEFLGWYKDEECTQVWTKSDIIKNGTEFTLYSKWGQMYTVSFDLGDAPEGTMAEVLGGHAFRLPALGEGVAAPDGKNFLGWSLQVNGSVIGTETISIEEDTTLHAVWLGADIMDADQLAAAVSASGYYRLGADIEAKNLAVGSGKSVGIDLNGHTIDATNSGRIFVNSGSLTLENGTIQNGKVTNDNGGGIYNAGTLSLRNVTIKDCNAHNTTTISSPANSNGKGRGGAIFNRGSLTIISSTIQGCSATSTNGTEFTGAGGAINHAYGTMTLTGDNENRTIISGFSASNDAGAIYIASDTTATTIEYTTITGKGTEEKVAGSGGALYIKKAGVVLRNSTFKDCYVAGNGGCIWGGANFTLENVTISGMKAGVWGGAIYLRFGNEVTLSGDTTITECTAGELGGAILTLNAFTLTLKDNATISYCTSAGDGGAIYTSNGTNTLTMQDNATITHCEAKNGGGIYSSVTTNFTMKDNAEITYCSANRGGGVHLAGSSSSMTMQDNAKITNCDAKKDGGTDSYGAAVHVRGSNTLEMKGNAQITDNRCQSLGGAIQLDDNTTFKVQDAVQVKDNSRVSNDNIETVEAVANIRINGGVTPVKVTAVLTEGASIGVFYGDGSVGGTLSSGDLPEGAEAFFHSDLDTYTVSRDGDVLKLVLVAAE